MFIVLHPAEPADNPEHEDHFGYQVKNVAVRIYDAHLCGRQPQSSERHVFLLNRSCLYPLGPETVQDPIVTCVATRLSLEGLWVDT